jgi:transglutaminase-like putative cysteine protease
MRLGIRHEFVHVFERPLAHSIALLRLTPRAHDGLRLAHWRVTCDGRRVAFTQRDGFGNLTHVHVVREPHTRLRFVAEGEVETTDTAGIVRGALEPLPPCFYLRSTPLTAPDAGTAALAAAAAGAADPLERLHRLLRGVRERLEPEVGIWQDPAHVFVAAARMLDVPARYVAGHRCAPSDQNGAEVPHAWAEVHVAGLGWLGFDPAGGVVAGYAYVACGVGLDAADAAALRGVPPASGVHDLTLRVAVAHVQQQ